MTPRSSGPGRVGGFAQVGAARASTSPRGAERVLRGVRTALTVGDGVGTAVLELAPLGPLPTLGEPLELDLDAGAGPERVFTGRVGAVRLSAGSLCVIGEDARAVLAHLDLCAAYADTTPGQIAADLARRAGVSVGELAAGPELGQVALHRGPRALRHLGELARLCGLDLAVDREGKLRLLEPGPAAPVQTFVWGESLLDFDLGRAWVADGQRVIGEGAGSAEGAERAHWLPAELDSVCGEAALVDGMAKARAEGERGVLRRSGALRSGESAEEAALARAQALAARPVRGWVDVLGCPAVGPGDWVALNGIPSGHSGAQALPDALRVRGVHHRLDLRAGFTTRLEL